MSDSSEWAELEAITRQRGELEEPGRYIERVTNPGDTEFEALCRVGFRGALFGWLGIIAAGAVGGLPFLIVGAVPGAVIAGMLGAVFALLALTIFLVLRGRLPIDSLMAWAGAATGSLLATLLFGSSTQVLWPNPLHLLLGAVGGYLGAVGGWLASNRSILHFRMAEGRGVRSARQFGIFDLLLVTAWLAVYFSALRWMGLDSERLLYLATVGSVWLPCTAGLAWFVARRGRSRQTRRPRRTDR